MLACLSNRAARLRAVPGADEHLRRPRQPAAAGAPLPLARDRLRAAAPARLGDGLDPDGADLYYIGGGQDRDQRLCALDLAEVKRDALHAVAARGGVILAVCGGYQLLGRSYQLGDETLPGVGLVDLGRSAPTGPG